MEKDILEEVRSGCRFVAERARFVVVREGRIREYAASVPMQRVVMPAMDPDLHVLGCGESTVAFLLTLDAVNFGSGFLPDILKDARRSGYAAVAAPLARFWREEGPLTAEQLAGLDQDGCGRIFRHDLKDPLSAELMRLFARSLNDVGSLLCTRFQGSFTRLVEEAGRSARRLAGMLAECASYADSARYDGMTVPFLKRAQLSAADLFIAFSGEGPGEFSDIDRLTICADNLVPHVLRLDGVLAYDPDLAAVIDRGELLPSGSPAEVEIRACAVHASELVVRELRRRDPRVNALMVDNFLWHRGQEPRYRNMPRHRTRTIFY